MHKANTAQIRGSVTNDGSKVRATLSGIARFASATEDVIARLGAHTIQDRVIGRRVYTRYDEGSWCRSNTDTYDALTVEQVVFSVKPAQAKPVWIGTTTIAKQAVTHYRLSQKGLPAVNYWLDRNHRIVRMRWQSTDGEHDTMDFYNYGSPVPAITAPAGAPPC